MNLRKIWPVVVASLLSAVAVAVLLPRAATPTVDWTIVAPRSTAGTIIAAGRVADNGVLPLSPASGGIITRVAVAEGAFVNAGDTLVVLDNRLERNRRGRCAADVTIASIRLEQHASSVVGLAREKVAQAGALESLAEKQCSRSDSMFQQGSISQSELDEAKKELAIRRSERTIAEADLAAAESSGVQLLRTQLVQARLALEAAEFELARTVLKAPFAGKVRDLAARPGARASMETPLMWLLSGDPATIIVQVGENDIARLGEGQKARIGCAGRKSIDAVVKHVVERIDTATHTATVVLSMQKSQPPLLPGQRVYAHIKTGDTARGTLLLDHRFVHGELPSPHVFVKQGGNAVRRSVRCDGIGDDVVFIRSGLGTGDTVVSAAGLSESSSIRLTEKPVVPVPVPGVD